MTGTHLIDVKDKKIKEMVEWIMRELHRNENGEVSVVIQKQDDKIVFVEKTVKHREK